MADKILSLTLTSDINLQVRHGEPVVIGVPLARHWAMDVQYLKLFDSQKRLVSCDIAVLDRWPDGSVRWALLAFKAESSQPQTKLELHFTADERESKEDPSAPTLHIKKEGGAFAIETGAATFVLGPGVGWPVRRVQSPGAEDWIDSPISGLQLTMQEGIVCNCNIRETKIEYAGNLRAVACCSGSTILPNGKRVESDWQLEFFAGLSSVIVHVTMRNPHRAMHPGGFWELGDSGSLLFREAVFRLNLGKPSPGASAWCSPESEKPWIPASTPLNLYQDSSGGKNWQSRNHVNREDRVPVAFQGYRSTCNPPEGLRATPIVSLNAPAGRLTLAARHFWQNFPKSLNVDDNGISYGLFPRQWNDLHELQGGEQKTHSFAISFGDDGITETPLDWFRQPLVPSLDSVWIEETDAIPCFTADRGDWHSQYRSFVDSAIEGSDTFEQKREAIDEYGWRHFGDLYGDHEAIYAKEFSGPGPLVSHYNNQYDPIAGFCLHWLRSGDSRWWMQFNELASHVTDIDIYHTREDKAAYNNGLFWHTFHYIDAGKATHRSYPRIGKSNGGGPANEQLYASGLRLHYLFTGNPASRDAAIGLAQFVIDIDDGSKTVFRWLSGDNTGLASQSGTPAYHGPGRGSGNAISVLIDGYLLTRERRFLEKAEQIISRVVHPKQNITALDLLDAERKWFYTMFLQALGRYLDLKVELGENDRQYAYARQCLLHFARWMAENEYLYLERPEVLEYPTETWPAQDLRKSVVFDFAGKYSNAQERSLFRERAEYFYAQALAMLAQHKTRTLTRPMVLLLTQGFAHAWFKKYRDVSVPTDSTSEADWGSPEHFIPQKVRAIRNGKRLAAILGICALAAMAALCWRFLL
jgi:hypothetical protein